jgi:hypothetical protein
MFVAGYSIGTMQVQIELSKDLSPLNTRSHYSYHAGRLALNFQCYFPLPIYTDDLDYNVLTSQVPIQRYLLLWPC